MIGNFKFSHGQLHKTQTRLYIEAWPDITLLVPKCNLIEGHGGIYANISESVKYTNSGYLSTYTYVTYVTCDQ